MTENDADDVSEDVQDWTQLLKLSGNAVPRRGEKDFEPLVQGEAAISSNYDTSTLAYSRSLMYNALGKKRGFVCDPKELLSATIYLDASSDPGSPDLFMTKPRGKFLETVGKVDKSGTCWFTFEETLYLVERGSCVAKIRASDGTESPPLSLQSLYASLLPDQYHHNKLLVYSALKRNGYIVIPYFEEPVKIASVHQTNLSRTLNLSWLQRIVARYFGLGVMSSYSGVFAYLRSLFTVQGNKELEPAISIAYNVWKPVKSFKKKSPPPPDFQIVIVDSISKIPKINELNYMFAQSESKQPARAVYGKQYNGEFEAMSSVLVAVVDNGLVNFYNLTSVNFLERGFVWQDRWVVKPKKKRGGWLSGFLWFK